jgi:hypothetical protein
MWYSDRIGLTGLGYDQPVAHTAYVFDTMRPQFAPDGVNDRTNQGARFDIVGFQPVCDLKQFLD